MENGEGKPDTRAAEHEKTVVATTRQPGPASTLADSGQTHRFPGRSTGGDEAEPVEEFPRFRSERYRLDRLIGEGGMGVVYRAFDTQLNRNVALKFLRGGVAPGDARRFVREARAQARVGHPNICEVHDVGEIDGAPYIAMQFIDGATCREASRQLTVEQKARLCRDVALALQAAHAAGLIHRDIKPGNILVAETEEGGYQPYVTDFGLARDLDEPSLTRMGEALGSPAYMAPEQAEGDPSRMDRRTDVYGLGATLYELLTGTPPFNGSSSFEVMMKVVNDEPVPVRRLQPGVPPDLETIVMKCLEKNSAARYDSARALALDLERFLSGEPLAAQRSSILDRLRRKARRNPIATSLVTTAVLAVLLSTGLAIGTAVRARQRERWSHSFGQEVERMVSLTRLSYLLPLHDIRPERELVHDRIRQIHQQMARLGAAAKGPGLYAVGRGYLELREDVEAERALRAAWEAGYQEPEAAYALGQVLGYRYQKEKADARRIANKEKKEARLAEIRATYREPAISFLLKGERTASASPLYVKGLIAFYEERYAEAMAHARRACEADPWFFEGHFLEGLAQQAVGFDRHVKGDYRGAFEAYRDSLSSYGRATEIARSSPTLLQQTCGVWLHLFEISVAEQLDPLPAGQQVGDCGRQIDDWCGRASRADPDAGAPYNILALKEWKWGRYVEDAAGLDPRGSYQRAMDLGREAARRDPKQASPHTWVAVGAMYWGEYLSEHGEDPSGCLWEAQQSLKEALADDPYYRVAYNASAVLGVDLARQELGRGRDPGAPAAWAIENAKKALEADPKYSHAYDSIATGHLARAEFLLATGADPAREFDLAGAALEEAQRINAHNTETFIASGRLNLARARHAISRKEEPASHLDQARHAAALAENASPGVAATLRGDCDLIEAWWLVERGQAAGEKARSARRQYGEALRIVPRSWGDLAGRATASLLLAASEPPGTRTRFLEDADHDLAAAARLNSRSADLVLLQAVLGRLRAGDRAPGTSPLEIDELVKKGLERNPLALKQSPWLAALLGR